MLYGNCLVLHLDEELEIACTCCCCTCLIHALFTMNFMLCHMDCSYEQGLYCNRGSDPLLLSCATHSVIKTEANHPSTFLSDRRA